MNSLTVARQAQSANFLPPVHGVLRRKCACGSHTSAGEECAECAKNKSKLQRKLTVGASNDPLEHEADRVAEQVLAAPKYPAASSAPMSTQRYTAPKTGDAGTAPASVHRVLSGTSTPLDPAARTFMEPRFGRDFSAVGLSHLAPTGDSSLKVGPADDPLERQADSVAGRVMAMEPSVAAARYDFSRVRIHTDEVASASVRELGARAYTVGEHIAFDRGEYAPETARGRRLLAHELTHTLQQAQTGVALQRFVPCTRARLSLEDCPEREPDEDRKSRAQPMILEYVTAPEVGFLVANFDIGKDTVKGGMTRHPLWPTLVKEVSAPNSQWEIIGLSDCHGEAPLNTGLRKERADAMRAALSTAAAKNVVATSGAPLNDCMTDNANAVARQWNRAVLITAVSREVTFENDTIKGQRPVPKPVEQDTVDCNPDQKKAIAQSQPIARDMLRKALLRIRDHNDEGIKQLLRNYFSDDSEKTFEHVHDGLLTTLQGLTDVTVECEAKDSWFYKHFCGSGSTVTVGYARSKLVGLHVHLCEAAFAPGVSDIELATTLVHECSHLYDGTSDKGYCWEDGNTACGKMGPSAAYNNADSYAYFARAAWLNE